MARTLTADALTGPPMHDGHARVLLVKPDACIEIAHAQRDMGQSEVGHRESELGKNALFRALCDKNRGLAPRGEL
jgi:hypothetical protein